MTHWTKEHALVGLICKILIDLVKSAGGDDAVQKVKAAAQLPEDRDYKLNSVYDDSEWRRLFEATCQVLGVTPEQAVQAFADFFLKDALARWPIWFKMSRSSRDFLLRQPAIHNSLASGIAEEAQRKAVADKFCIQETVDGLVTHYRSANGLCGLYQALASRVIAHYGDEATIEERCCALKGAGECEIHIRWTRCNSLP